MKRIEAWAAAHVFPCHLPDDYLGIGIDVKSFRLARDGILQGFHQSDVFGNIVVLASNPFGNAHGTVSKAADYDANARRSWISQAPPST